MSTQQASPLSNSTSVPSPLHFMILAGVMAAIFVWRIFISSTVNLIPDECSYWTWSRYLDWSYFDNAGMVAYLIRVSTFLFGEHTPWAVRFPFLVFSGWGTYLIYRVSRLLFENRTRALAAAVFVNIWPVSLAGGSAAMHDNALLFFWTAALWGAVKLIKSEDGRWFYFLGATAGLAIQSKYTGVLVMPALLFFLIWSTPHRRWLIRKETWIGALIAGVFTLPIVYWNIKHDWASLYHILHIGSGAPALMRNITDGIAYHLAQFFIISPQFYVALIAGAALGISETLRKPDPGYRLLICFSFPLAFFGIMAFKGHVEANWAVMGYPSAAILAVEVIFGQTEQAAHGVRKWFTARFLKWAVVLAVAPVAIVAVHAWIGLLPAAVEKRFAKEDRVIWETRGWDGLGKHVGSLVHDGDVIAADRYQLCAVLEYNVPGNPEVRYLAPWRRPTAFDVRRPSYDDLNGKDIIFVAPEPLVPSSDVHSTIYENFKRVDSLPPYEVKYHGETIRNIYLQRGVGFNSRDPRKLGPKSLFYREE